MQIGKESNTDCFSFLLNVLLLFNLLCKFKAYNDFTGTIPSEIGLLKGLNNLELGKL